MRRRRRQGGAEDTPQRILSVAERLFAEKGYEGASVREITSKSKVHLSAINYHFRSKKNLYLSVFEERFIPRAKKVQAYFKERLKVYGGSKEGVIRALAESLLAGPLSYEEKVLHYQILVRELTSPSEAFELIMEEGLKPLLETFEKALSPFLPNIHQNFKKLLVLSIFFQILQFNFARNIVKALVGRDYDEEFLETLTSHIVAFSLKGLEGYETKRGGSGDGRKGSDL